MLYNSSVKNLFQQIADYWNEQANQAAQALASLSPRQKQIVSETILKNADEFTKNEVFRARESDVYHSGRAAFEVTESEKADKQE